MMNNDLISKKALLEQMDRMFLGADPADHEQNGIFKCRVLVKEAPVIEAEPMQDKLELSERVLMLEEHVRHLTSEKEALMTQLKEADIHCNYCEHGDTVWKCDGDCSFCTMTDECNCRECDDNSHWEWVGIKEEDK